MKDKKDYLYFFTNNYIDVLNRAKVLHSGFNRGAIKQNSYTAEDLLHDLFLSFYTTVSINGKNLLFDNLNHFIAVGVIRMKSIYIAKIKNKSFNNQLNRDYLDSLDKDKTLSYILDSDASNILNDGFTTESIVNVIKSLKKPTHVSVLLLKSSNMDSLEIQKALNLTKKSLTTILCNARACLINELKNKGAFKKGFDVSKITGVTTSRGCLKRKVRDVKNLYNDFDFNQEFYEKICFVLDKNDGRLKKEVLSEIIKYNDGIDFRIDNRGGFNHGLKKAIKLGLCDLKEGYVIRLKK